MVGDGMVGRSLEGTGETCPVSESRSGVRTLIVATKRRNRRGAKGRRKVDEWGKYGADKEPKATPVGNATDVAK